MADSTDAISRTKQDEGTVLPLPQPATFSVIRTLCWREIIRFLRQRNRVIGAVGQPILFWLLFGAGLQRSFRLSEAGGGGLSFLEYYFPGSLMLVMMFTAIFATISIIEDRREGFLQSVLVAPIPRWTMVMGKVLGGTLLALLQGVIFLLLSLTLRQRPELISLAWTVVLLFVSGIGLTSFGFLLAWRMESTQGFHAIMNLLLMPMWLLSGAFWPARWPAVDSSVGEVGMFWVMRLNPLTYGVSGVRQLLAGKSLPAEFFEPSLAACWSVSLLFALLAFFFACKISGQRTTGDLL